MRRLARHTVTLLATVSLLLCVAACVLSVRSRFVADEFYLALHGEHEGGVIDSHGVVSARGTLQYTRWRSLYVEPTLQLWREGDVRRTWSSGPQHLLLPLHNEGPPDDVDFPSYTWMGFHWSDTRESSMLPDGMPASDRAIAVCVPYAALAGLLATLPSILAFRRVKRYRHRSRSTARCPTCGYDLRAGHERCPECGAAVALAEPGGSQSPDWTGRPG